MYWFFWFSHGSPSSFGSPGSPGSFGSGGSVGSVGSPSSLLNEQLFHCFLIPCFPKVRTFSEINCGFAKGI